MSGDDRKKILGAILLAMVLLSVIASGLDRLEFKPGIASPVIQNDQFVIRQINNGPAITLPIENFLLITFLIIWGIMLVYSVYEYIVIDDWKYVLSRAFKLLKGLSAIYAVLLIAVLVFSKTEKPVEKPLDIPSPAIKISPPLLSIDPIVIWIIGISLLLVTIILSVWFFKSSQSPALNVEVMRLEAEKARQAIIAGKNLRDVILQCYEQMSLALQQEKGIKRQESMTSTEFESLLEGMGFPRVPVHQLTYLFEAVRYGNWQPEPGDELKAINSLESIVQFGHEAGRAD